MKFVALRILYLNSQVDGWWLTRFNCHPLLLNNLSSAQMTIEMQELILFGGLAKVRTKKPIDSGYTKISENAIRLIGMKCIQYVPKTINERVSFVWNKVRIGGVLQSYPRSFSNKEFRKSYIWHTDAIKNLVYLSISTWRELTQDKIVSSLGVDRMNNSVMSSISSNLDAGRRGGLYQKVNSKKLASYSLSDEFLKSKQMERIHFAPSPQAIRIAKLRAKNYA